MIRLDGSGWNLGWFETLVSDQQFLCEVISSY
jgi:hypothetical protein